MKVVFVAFLFGLAAALPHQPKASVCGYDSCPKPVANKLNVHMVPHTHDDVGWLKTVDQYYYGSRSNIQTAGVQYILDSVIDQLLKDPAKKFIYVETAFFWKWWVEQTPELQEQVKGLVNSGQLEFIGGAWSMNDEATTHYHTTIDQFTWGLRRLNDTFGSCGVPRVGWQIDPFGHSREQASLMAQYNFDGMFYARQDYQDRDNRLRNKAQEVIWETDDSLGDQTDLLTGALYAFYGAPGGFCFDVYCGDEPIIDNPDIPDYNVPRRVEEFVTFLNEQKQYYRTNNIMLSMGGDFQYMDASINFKNMDKLIKATNELHPEMNVFYSTPSCYVKSLNEANITWPTKQDDFFPYGSGPHTYWTGYFTSRPSLKRFERLAHNVLQVGKQLAAVVDIDDDVAEQLTVHKEAQGILQHHDAVAGTEKQHVAEDYARLLQIGVEATENVIAASLNTLLLQDQSAAPLSFSSCPLRNISECAVTENSESFLVTVYNPLSRNVNSFVRFPVSDSPYSIIAPNGDEIEHQILQIPDHLARVPGREAKTTHDALFEAKNIPPFGYKTFYVTKVDDKKSTKSASRVWVPTGNQDVVVGDEDFSLTFDGKSKLLKSIGTPREIYDTVQSLEYYIGVIGDNGAEERRSSGAYCFRPTTNDSFAMSDGSNITIVDGPLVSEVHQIFSDWASQVIRHYYGHDVVEFEWLVGPIPIEDGDGKEVVMKWRTNLETDGVLVTDTSGRNDLTRKRDFRPTWDLEVHEPVAGNYYPIVLDAWIDNGTDRLALVTDRAQGAASIKDGELEVMVHRRLLHDDAFGAGEALNEEAYGQGLVARGTHWVLVGPTDGVASTQNIRLMEQQKASDSLAYFTDVSGKSYDDIKNSINLAFSGLTTSLPDEVQLLTLEPWKDNTLLLRLENIFTTEQQDSDSVTVDLSDLFTTFTITSARETTLAANQWLSDASRLQWKKEGSAKNTPGERSIAPVDLEAVTLTPKQIRTFIVTVEPKNKKLY